jgi:hypothetical protein
MSPAHWHWRTSARARLFGCRGRTRAAPQDLKISYRPVELRSSIDRCSRPASRSLARHRVAVARRRTPLARRSRRSGRRPTGVERSVPSSVFNDVSTAKRLQHELEQSEPGPRDRARGASVDQRGARDDQRGAPVDGRGAGDDERGAPVDERRARDDERRAPVDQRGAADDERELRQRRDELNR